MNTSGIISILKKATYQMVYDMWNDFFLMKKKSKYKPCTSSSRKLCEVFFKQSAVSTPKGAFKYHIIHM